MLSVLSLGAAEKKPREERRPLVLDKVIGFPRQAWADWGKGNAIPKPWIWTTSEHTRDQPFDPNFPLNDIPLAGESSCYMWRPQRRWAQYSVGAFGKGQYRYRKVHYDHHCDRTLRCSVDNQQQRQQHEIQELKVVSVPVSKYQPNARHSWCVDLSRSDGKLRCKQIL